jgi:hypothetical protein
MAIFIVVFIPPIKHTLALLEVFANMVDSFLPGGEAMPTETALAWKLGL